MAGIGTKGEDFNKACAQAARQEQPHVLPARRVRVQMANRFAQRPAPASSRHMAVTDQFVS